MMTRTISLFFLLLTTNYLMAERSFLPIDIGSVTSPSGVTNPRGFWEFLPSSYFEEPEREFAVVVFLHGLGSGGNGTSDLSEVLANGPAGIVNNPSHPLYDLFENENVILLAPQVTDNTWWNYGHIRPFLDFVTDYYRIDARRIYLTGLSAGAQGVHSFMNNDPNAAEVAAFVPCAIRGQVVVGEGDALAEHTAYWALSAFGDLSSLAFNSGDRLADYLVDPAPASVLSTYAGSTSVRTASFRTADGWTWEEGLTAGSDSNVRVTIFTGSSHNSWDRTYDNPLMWSWLFDQEKPTVAMTAPSVDRLYETGEAIVFTVTAVDREGTVIPDSNITWSSNLSGHLGNGASFTRTDLEIGVHAVTVEVIDPTFHQSIRHTRLLKVLRADQYTARFDIGSADYTTDGWNNLTDYKDGIVANAFDLDANPTGVRVALVAPFGGPQINGVLAEDLYPESVQRDTHWVENGSAAAQLEFSGLNPNRSYTMEIFASRTAGNDRTANYNASGIMASLNAANNSDQTVVLGDLRPNENGEFVLSVECDAAATYGYVGAIILTALPTAHELWMDTHFSAAEQDDVLISGDLGDPDHDSILNVFEYAFGLDPRLEDAAQHMPQLVTQSGRYGLRFLRDTERDDLVYEVLASSDLVDWEVIARSRDADVTSDLDGKTRSITETGDTTKEVEVLDASEGASRFYQFRIKSL